MIYGRFVTRTDRLYAIVAELRDRASGPRSARDLADRFGVGARTIERDIDALRQAGVPIRRTESDGGYALDTTSTLPPMNLSAAEAIAVAISLGGNGSAPVTRSARSALLKVVAAMSAADDAETRRTAEQVRLLVPDDEEAAPVAAVVEESVATRQVVRITYAGRDGTETHREVEPVAYVAGSHQWHLIGWCRLRDAPRIFRVDRIRQASLLDEIAPSRDYSRATPSVPDLLAAALRLD